MITITLQNLQTEFQEILNDNRLFCHLFIKETFPILLNNGGDTLGVYDRRLFIRSPLPLRLRAFTEENSHLLIFRFNKDKYTFDDIIPRFMDYLGRVFIIEDMPYVDENYNLIFKTQALDALSMIFPVITSSNELLFVCYLDPKLCEKNKERFQELGFPEEEFDVRLDDAAESLYEEFK